MLVAACTDDAGSNAPAADVADATGDVSGGDLSMDGDGDQGSSNLSVGALNVVQNPASVLSAFVLFSTSEPAECTVEYGPTTDYGLWTNTGEKTASHELTVVQMRANTTYHLRASCTAESSATVTSEDATFTTGSLPDDLPEVSVTALEPEQMAPGITVIGAGGGQQDVAFSPYYFGVDETGEVVWYYRLTQDTEFFNDRSLEMLSDGNLLITTPNGFSVITIGGEVVLEFRPQDTGRTVYHHDAIQLPNGRFMTFSQVVQSVTVDWSDDPISVLGDLIIELDADGNETWEWSSFDHLDSTRFPSMLSRTGGRGGSYDWTHANSLYYVEADDSILVSLRHQNWVIKIDRATGDVIWRLGEDGDFDLTNMAPSDADAWFYGQHAAEIHDDGTVLLYDNGIERPSLAPFQWYSRGVMYQLDEEDMTVEQTWTYAVEHFTNYLGDADLLDNGNILLTAGGQEDPDIPAQVVEVTSGVASHMVWLLEIYGYSLYRATRLPSFYLD